MRVPSFQTRLVHVVAGDGFSRYLAISNTWQWLRLAWTFRNFSELREQVLSARQRHLLLRLRHAGSGQAIDASHVIGTIELPPKRIESFFGTAPEPAATEPGRTPSSGIAPIQRPVLQQATTPAIPSQQASVRNGHGHRSSSHAAAVTACMIVVLGSFYAWQRFAHTGYIPTAVTVPPLAELTP